jgi:TRAP-type C4-dicarboxylate transport system substrate-binding protein
MQRRNFMKTGVATFGLLATPAILRAASAVELTVVHGSPNAHIISAGGVEPWMENLKEIVGDAVSFRYYPGGQLANLKGLLSAIQSGVADAVPIPVGYASDKMPLNGVSMLPGLGSSAKTNIQAYAAALKTPELSGEFSTNGVVPIWNMAFPPYQIFSSEGPIKSYEDFNGRVIRSAGGSMNLAIQSLGAAPAEIPASDIYVAMERGTVGATLSAFSSVKGYGVQELCDAASSNGSFGTFTNVFSIRQEKWDTIPEDIRAAMMEAGALVEKSVATRMDGETDSLAAEFAANGMHIYEIPAEELVKINGALEAVHTDWVNRLAERELPAQSVLDAYRAAAAGLS